MLESLVTTVGVALFDMIATRRQLHTRKLSTLTKRNRKETKPTPATAARHTDLWSVHVGTKDTPDAFCESFTVCRRGIVYHMAYTKAIYYISVVVKELRIRPSQTTTHLEMGYSVVASYMPRAFHCTVG